MKDRANIKINSNYRTPRLFQHCAKVLGSLYLKAKRVLDESKSDVLSRAGREARLGFFGRTFQRHLLRDMHRSCAASRAWQQDEPNSHPRMEEMHSSPQRIRFYLFALPPLRFPSRLVGRSSVTHG